jgi:uncharacterized protein (TIGR02466 family)
MTKDHWWMTPIWVLHIDPTQIDFNKIIKEVYKLQKKDKGRIVSNYGGWQSNVLDLKADTEINKLLKEIERQAQVCFEELDIKPLYTKKIDTAWININKKSDSNAPHLHPNSILSGCVYIQSDDKAGNIKIHRNAMEAYYYSTYINSDNQYSYEHVYYKPIEHTAIVFPSYLMHSVEPSNSEQDRISIAYNLY